MIIKYGGKNIAGIYKQLKYIVFIIIYFNKSLTNYICISKYLTMFQFDQYLGFIAFLTIVTIGFWLMIFLITFVVPYWIGGSLIERLKEIKAAKKAKQS